VFLLILMLDPQTQTQPKTKPKSKPMRNSPRHKKQKLDSDDIPVPSIGRFAHDKNTLRIDHESDIDQGREMDGDDEQSKYQHSLYDRANKHYNTDQFDAMQLLLLTKFSNRTQQIQCCVCMEFVKLKQPVVCDFTESWNINTHGDRCALQKLRDHCQKYHPHEYIWKVVPNCIICDDSDSEEENKKLNDMDELIRFSLERAACICTINILSNIACHKMNIETKSLIVSKLIHSRCDIARTLIQYGCKEIIRKKQLFKHLDKNQIRKEAISNITRLEDQLQLDLEFNRNNWLGKKNHDRYINYLQLCFVQKGKWRDEINGM